jgi:hypothetical protein
MKKAATIALVCGIVLTGGNGFAAVSVKGAATKSDHGVSGLWMVINPQQFPADAPLTPNAKTQTEVDKRMVADGLAIGERSAKCLPVGNPGMMVNEFALNILEGPGQIMIVSENNSIPRIIYMDGRKHDVSPGEYGWNGHSIGHWDKSVLSVDTTSFNDHYAVYTGQTLSPHRTSALHMTERLWLEAGGDVLADEMTFDDKGTFTAPVKNLVRYRRLKPPEHFMEDACEVQVDAIAKNAAWRASHAPNP